MVNQGFRSALLAIKRAKCPPAECPITMLRVMSMPGNKANWPQARRTSESVSIQTPSSPSSHLRNSMFQLATPASLNAFAIGCIRSDVYSVFQNPPWINMMHGTPWSFWKGDGSSGICRSAYCQGSAPHCIRSMGMVANSWRYTVAVTGEQDGFTNVS